MSLPDSIRVEMAFEGFIFEFRVSALLPGCERLYPGQACADEFQQSADLPAAVARAASSALASAARQFQTELEGSLMRLLVDRVNEMARAGPNEKVAA